MASLVYTVILIASVLILVRKKSDEESMFPLKLIGYFILGSFAFHLSQISLPVGFVVYLLFFRPKRNGKVKRSTTILGLLAFVIVHWMIPFAIEKWDTRTISIDRELGSVYSINFQEEFDLVKEELNVDADQMRLENFEVDYTENGRMTDLKWQLIIQNEDRYNLYQIRYATDKKRYEISYSHSDEWLQYEQLIDADRFFDNLTILDIERITDVKNEYSSYVIRSTGERIYYGVENAKHYHVVDGEIELLDNERLPVECYYISTYAMKKTGEEKDAQGKIRTISHEGTEPTDYLFDVNFDVE